LRIGNPGEIDLAGVRLLCEDLKLAVGGVGVQFLRVSAVGVEGPGETPSSSAVVVIKRPGSRKAA
jgi:hypothetical protein